MDFFLLGGVGLLGSGNFGGGGSRPSGHHGWAEKNKLKINENKFE